MPCTVHTGAAGLHGAALTFKQPQGLMLPLLRLMLMLPPLRLMLV
jgi:hypothetical protein